MPRVLFISVLFLMSFSASETNRYELIFKDEYGSALYYLNKNKQVVIQACKVYNNKPELACAVVFPELLRYNIISDVIETSALEMGYVEEGKELADFSIGRFQMKPSFSEEIERLLYLDELLNEKYKVLQYKAKLTEKEIRIERIKRLKSLSGQVIYLNAFLDICHKNINTENRLDENEQVLLYSTAYNSGVLNSPEKLKEKSKKEYFPYGARYKGKQYSYSDVAAYFYQKTLGVPVSITTK